MPLNPTLQKLLPALHPELAAARQALDAERARFKDISDRIRADCAHEYIVEAPHRRAEWLNSSPPFRMCLVCRREEHSWHFHKGATINEGPAEFHGLAQLLAPPFAALTRDELYDMRV
jgi:hypothetical protein